jgi:hypothetical protein
MQGEIVAGFKLAKHPCRAKVSENGNTVTCFDMYRVIRKNPMDGRKRVVTCASHNHAVRGKAAELYR